MTANDPPNHTRHASTDLERLRMRTLPELPLTVADADDRAAHWVMVAEQRLGAAFALEPTPSTTEDAFLARRAQATAEAHAAGQLAETWALIAANLAIRLET